MSDSLSSQNGQSEEKTIEQSNFAFSALISRINDTAHSVLSTKNMNMSCSVSRNKREVTFQATFKKKNRCFTIFFLEHMLIRLSWMGMSNICIWLQRVERWELDLGWTLLHWIPWVRMWALGLMQGVPKLIIRPRLDQTLRITLFIPLWPTYAFGEAAPLWQPWLRGTEAERAWACGIDFGNPAPWERGANERHVLCFKSRWDLILAG